MIQLVALMLVGLLFYLARKCSDKLEKATESIWTLSETKIILKELEEESKKKLEEKEFVEDDSGIIIVESLLVEDDERFYLIKDDHTWCFSRMQWIERYEKDIHIQAHTHTNLYLTTKQNAVKQKQKLISLNKTYRYVG